MKKAIAIVALLGLVVTVVAMSFNQSMANPGHKQSMGMVVDGLKGQSIVDVFKAVSDAADAKCEAYYREIGMMKNIPNHRFMGHWGWSGDIPEEVFTRAKAQGVSKDQIISVWRRIHKETVDIVMQKTGLPAKQADALAGLLYDTHLLHDYTGHFSDALQKPDLIRKDLIKNLHRLLGNNSTFVKQLEQELNAALVGVPESQRAQVMMQTLFKNKIGEQLFGAFGERFLKEHGITYAEGCVSKLATATASVKEQFFTATLRNAITECDVKVSETSLKKVVKGVYSEIQRNGHKAYRLQIPLQFSTEERIASSYAKECLNLSGGKLSEAELQRIVEERLRDSAVAGTTGRTLTQDEAAKIAHDAAQWAKLERGKLAFGLKTGILTFIISEGVTVLAFSETDMSEDEFWRQTEKNIGSAILEGAATYCLVALGANPFTWPGGLVIMGVSIGSQILYDFAWTRLQRELDSRYFTLDDFIGDLPPEIRDRTTVLSVGDFAAFNKANSDNLNAINYLRHLEATSRNALTRPESAPCGTSLNWKGYENALGQPVRYDNSLQEDKDK